MTEYLKIDPLEELIKAFGIVHGRSAADRVRFILASLESESQRALNKIPWTQERIQYVLDKEVRYKDWHFVVDERQVIPTEDVVKLANAVIQDFVDGAEISSVNVELDLRLRAEWMGADAVTGAQELQQSRWWPLNVHMCKTEIIQTAFLCVMKAEEHEIRETFQYKGRAPFHTHIDVDTLAGVSVDVDVRTDPRPEAPKNQRRE